MSSLAILCFILLLVLVNALFVAAEFAIVGASRAAIERRALQGNRVARRISRILHDTLLQDRYIATAQLGITFASLGLGMYGEHSLAECFDRWLEASGISVWGFSHAMASFLSIALLTYLHIVLGEMVPKSLALQYAERTALWVAPIMHWIKIVWYPLVVGLNGIGNVLLKLLRVERQLTAGHYLTTEELQFIVQESRDEGLLRAESGRVLQDLLEFGDLTAAEVMVPRVRMMGIPVNAQPEEIKSIVRLSHHSRYPVFEGDMDHILGVVHIKDLLKLLLEELPVMRDHLRVVPYVPETSKLDGVLAAMRRRRTHMAVVMDEFGGTAGLITIEDLFDEVVGDIDHGIEERQEIVDEGDGCFLVPGTLRLDELGEHLGITLEHEEVYTVSGLVLTLLERQPHVGSTVTYDQVQFEVTAVRGHGVGECRVRLVAPEHDDGGEPL